MAAADDQKAAEAKAAAEKAAAEQKVAEEKRLADEKAAAEAVKPSTTKFTVVVHTAILLNRNLVTDKTTDRVLTLGDEPDLDPDDEFVARLVELKAIRPTADVKREQATRQKVAQAQAELRALNAANVDEALAKARAEADAPELTVP